MRFTGSTFIAVIFLSACGGVSSPLEQPSFVNISALAALGPISAGEVNIYRLSDNTRLNTSPIKTTELADNMFSASSNKLYKSATVGDFDAALSIPQNMMDEDLVKIVVTGGQDIDSNDDFIVNQADFQTLQGEAVAITTWAQLKTGEVVVNALSTLAASTAVGLTSEAAIKNRLSQMARKLLSTELFAGAEKGDISGNQVVDFTDLALFNPKLQNGDTLEHSMYLQSMQMYQSLLPRAGQGVGESSFIDTILNNDRENQQRFADNLLAGYLYRDILQSIIEDINGNADGLLTSADKLNSIAGVAGAIIGAEISYHREFAQSVMITNPNNPTEAEINSINSAISNVNIWRQNSPEITSSNTLNIGEDALLIGILSATDEDENDRLIFTIIGGDDSGLLNLSEHGTLSFKAQVDFENPIDLNADNNYQLIIAVTDLAGNQATQSLSVVIVDQLEPSEVFARIANRDDLSVAEYNVIGLTVDVFAIEDMNILVSSREIDEVDSQDELQVLLDFVNLPIVSFATSEVDEGQNLIFSLALSAPSGVASLECVSTDQGSASPALDFVASSMQLSHFPSSFSLQTLVDGSTDETNESVIIRCINPSGLRFNDILADEMSLSGIILGDINSSPVAENLLIANAIEHAITSVLDIQGVIDDPISVSLPYTLTGSTIAALAAYSSRVTIIDSNLSEQGETGVDLTFAWAAQTLSQSGNLTATLSIDDSNASGTGASDGAYQLKRLNPSEQPNGVVLANFAYPFDSAGNTGSAVVKIVPGILDRNYGDGIHDFLYLPVQSTQTGKIWLNNNLGANYANSQHERFNPVQQAQDYNDTDAYGSKFQWGRLADGHELDGGDWLVVNNAEPALWQGVGAVNAVCPNTFRLPTFAEFEAEFGDEKNDDLTDADNGRLKLTITGYRNSDGNLAGSGNGYYWSADTLDDISRATNFYLSDTNVNTFSRPKVNGYAVRCIRDF